MVPFWAAWPFETLLIPARTVGHLSGLFPDERDALELELKREKALADAGGAVLMPA